MALSFIYNQAMPLAPKPRRRWVRFSLRALLLLVTVSGIVFAFFLRWHEKAIRQRDSVLALSSDGSNQIYYENGRDPEFNAPPVPQRFRGLLDFHHFYSVVDVSLSNANDHQMRMLENFPDLESLCLISASQCTGAGFARLRSMEHLKRLELFDIPCLDDQALAVVTSLDGLEYLSVECGDKVSDAGLARLSRLTNLRSLRLKRGLMVTDRGLAALAKLSSLEHLNLDLDDAVPRDRQIRGHALSRLGELTRLTTLEIDGNAALNDECLSNLRRISGLTSLTIKATAGLTDRAAAYLAESKALQTLILVSKRGRQTNAGMASLAELSGLKKLEIALGPSVTDDGLAALNACPKLQRLKLHLNDRVTGEGLAAFGNLRYLELDFKAKSADAPPTRLRLPTELEDLVIHGYAGLSDDELSVLVALNKLHQLDLFWCEKASDKALMHLRSLTQLSQLGIYWCDRVTDAGIAGLRTALPNCNITVSKGSGTFVFWSRF